jgi:hypothetical protein
LYNSAGKFKGKLSLRGIWCYERIILQWISKEEDEGMVWMNMVKAKDQRGIPSERQTKLWAP